MTAPADDTPEPAHDPQEAVQQAATASQAEAAKVKASDAEASQDQTSQAEAPEDGVPEGEPDEIETQMPVFADLHLSPETLRAVDEKGYRHPTPIQAQAIPVVLMGRDVMGCAQTGTGKTAGFTLPMIDILAGSRARARMPRSLILEPTRELALQVAENFVAYGKYVRLNHALLIGGESLSDQRDALMRGVDVLIATPGRLLDLFERGGLLLSDVKILVIDEADRMLDMGFIPDVERIVGLLPANRQTLFFSATMAPEIRRLADAFLQNPKTISVSPPASVAATITQGLAVVAEAEKREALRRLIRTEEVQNALIFCNRKRDVDILHKSLVRHDFRAGALHGDMTQPMRFATLERFKAGDLHLLVCSDVAARGLDIGGLSHVFNFDVPHHAEDYVHRIGRTGRAGREGRAFTIANPEDRLAVEAIEKLIDRPIPLITIDGIETAEWEAADGRRGRGRGRGGRPAADKRTPRAEAKPRRAPDKRAPDKIVAGSRVAEPRTDRSPEGEPFVEARQPELAGPDAQSQAQNRGSRRYGAQGRGERGRDEITRSEPRHADAPRNGDRPLDRGPRRDRPRRDEDLGPSVIGFGDDVPAFMLIRPRTRAAA